MAELGGWLFGIATVTFLVVVALLVVLAVSTSARRRGLWPRVIRPMLWVWTVVTVAWLALSPVWSANAAPEPEETFDVARIRHYEADFRLSANGDLAVTERVEVYFPVGRHGIFRFFDVVDRSAPTARRLPEDVRVTRDGRPEPADRSTRDGGRFIVYRIGDPAVEIEGAHAYSISYRIRGVIEPGATGERSQFYWNLIPGGWTMPIDTADLRVALPVPAGATVRCALGSRATRGCAVSGAGTRRLAVQTGALPERTPVTIKTGLDIETPPTGHERRWSQPWDAVLGGWSAAWAPIALAVVALLTALAGWAGWRARRRVVETEPPFPVMYAPPDGIGPGQAAYLLEESVSRPQFIATLLYLAQRKVITVERTDRGWTIGNGPSLEGPIDPVSKAAIAALPLHAGKPIRIDTDTKVGKKLQLSETNFLAAPRRWALEHGFVAEVERVGRSGFFAVVSLLAAFVIAAFGFGMSVLCLVPLAFALPALGVIRSGASTRRTEAARRLWSEVGGFKRMLATPSSEQRFDFSARRGLYTAYIPWAIAFGVADRWAEKYRIETGEEPPAPGYVGGVTTGSTTGGDTDWTTSHGGTSMASALEASFAAAVGSAIGAYVASTAPSPSSSSSSSSSSWSSSSSGGGFSGGGGGGGGGGGSW